jgi:hypothetical protein
MFYVTGYLLGLPSSVPWMRTPLESGNEIDPHSTMAHTSNQGAKQTVLKSRFKEAAVG